MRMDEGLDTGPVLFEMRHAIGERDTAQSLTDALAQLGAKAIVQALANLPRLSAQPQDASRATYASKISKAEAQIDWSRTNAEIDRQVRAFNPVPGAETRLEGQALKIWSAKPAEGAGSPGKVLYSRNSRFLVACGEGALEVLEIQRSSGRRMPIGEFLRGSPVPEGVALGEKPLASA